MRNLAIIFFTIISLVWYYISWYKLKSNNNFVFNREILTAILLAWNFMFWFLLAKLVYKKTNKKDFKEELEENFLEKNIEENNNIKLFEKDNDIIKDNIDIILDEKEENFKHKINLKRELLEQKYKKAFDKIYNNENPIDRTLLNVAKNLSRQKRQNLQIIEWIWPKIEILLNKNWIYSYKDLANTEVDKLKNILKKANKRYIILHNPITWPKQASFAQKWLFKELEEYQKKLVKGIEVDTSRQK